MIEFFPLNKNLLILLIFFILSLVGILYHEIWLDEAQHFLLAKDSNNLSDLLFACRNEGHPLLWNILLFILTKFSDKVFYMQLLHILINCFSVIIITRSNLNFLEKIFIIFGFYFLYEYNIISRNYGLSAFLLLLLVYNYLLNKEKIIFLSVIIFFLSNTHLFSLLISFAFVFTYLIYNRSILLQQNKKLILSSVAIIVAGWLISVYSVIPPGDYGFKFLSYDSSGWFSAERIVKSISLSLKGLFYIPDLTIPGNYYESTWYFLSLNLSNWKIILLAAFAIIIPAYILKNNRFAFTLYCSFMLIYICAFFFLPLNSGIRYFGFSYLIFIACYWIARPQITNIQKNISFVIFTIQFINGVFMYSLDLRYPFSEAKNVSAYLNEIKKPDENVFILNRTARPAISAYSGEKYFGVESGELLSSCFWQLSLPDSVLKLKINNELNKNNSALIISVEIPVKLLDTTKLSKLKTFNAGIVRGENVTVYRYQK